MPAELGQTTDPKQLVPGEPEAISGDLRELVGVIGKTEGIGNELSAVDPASWTGEASNAFREQFGVEPPKWLRAGDALAAGGKAVAGYADVLNWAQGRAMRAIELYTQAEAASTVAAQQFDAQLTRPGADPAAVFHDPGAAGRNEAQAILDNARKRQADAGNQAAHGLIVKAPPERVWTTQTKKWGTKQSGGMLGDVIGSTLKSLGVDIGTTSASASAGTSLLSGKAAGNFEDGSLSGAGRVAGSVLGADVQAHGSASVLGVTGGASAEAYLAKGSADGALAFGKRVGVTGHAGGEIGAKAEASGSIGVTGVQGKVGGFAGAKISGNAGADVSGVNVGVHGEAWAGGGVEAQGQFGMGDDGKFHIGASLGVGLGVGGKAGFNIAVDPGEMVDTVKDVAGDIDHAISDTASALTGGLL
ncbi:MAG: putative T7SS-secreted protein [Sciscionella sp.]